MRKIVLASASPRRRELLTLAGVDFTVDAADCDETLNEGIFPEDAVKILSERKAEAVFEKRPDCTVIGADTVVACGGKILGKPADEAEAVKMLSLLSGKTHSVYTGVCIVNAEKKTVFAQKTDVTFYELTQEEIESYVSTGDCLDKAGAYGIQSRGCVLVEKIDGDYFNVVGLPVAETVKALNGMN